MLLYAAAQLVRVVLVFDREVYRLSLVIVDPNETGLFQGHQRLFYGDFDVFCPVEPPAAYAVLPVEQLHRRLQLRLPYGEGVRLNGVYVYPNVCQQLVGLVGVDVVVLHQQLLDVSESVCQRRLRRQVQNEEASAHRD